MAAGRAKPLTTDNIVLTLAFSSSQGTMTRLLLLLLLLLLVYLPCFANIIWTPRGRGGYPYCNKSSS